MKTKPKLEYLFEADFADGTTYHQGADDESLTHPKDSDGNGPSAYRDVQDRLSDVVKFRLFNNDHVYQVDLTDGHFEVDGAPFELEHLFEFKNIQLIYGRFVNVKSTLQAGKELSRAHYVDRYVIGFSAFEGAKEVEHTIAIRGAHK